MIEGLKVTVTGDELKQLCRERAQALAARAQQLNEQAKSVAEIVGGNESNSADPKREMRSRAREANELSAELIFVSEHLVQSETYLLDRVDLHKLGICRSAF